MGGAIQGVGAGVTGIIQSQGAKNAANSMNSGYNQAETSEQKQNDVTNGYLLPYNQMGQQSANNLSSMAGPNGQLGRQFTMADYQADPAYKFDLAQGQAAINNSASVRGGSLSGGTQKALSNYSENQANNSYQQALTNFTNNQNQNFSQLSSMAGQGMQASNSLAQLGQQQGTNMANLYMGQATNQANEYTNKANAFATANNTAAAGASNDANKAVGIGMSMMGS